MKMEIPMKGSLTKHYPREGRCNTPFDNADMIPFDIEKRFILESLYPQLSGC